MDEKLEQVKEMIRRIVDLEEAAWRRTLDPALADRQSYFSIWVCNQCSAPTFQQPCPFCNFWVITDSMREEDRIYKKAAEDREKNRLTFERFEQTVNRAGNYAALRLGSWQQSVAYYTNTHYRDAADWAIQQALEMECPDPRTIWDVVAEHGGIHVKRGE